MMNVSHQELAVLLATRCSAYAQSAEQLAQRAETSNVHEALTRLARRKILQPFEGYTTDGTLGIVYGYAANDHAQQIYCAVHGLADQ